MDLEQKIDKILEILMNERRPARLLKLPDVAERVGLSPSSYLKGVRESGFPAGFKHGNNRLWLESDIEALIERMCMKGGSD